MFFAVIFKVNLSLPSFYIVCLVYRAPIWELNSKLVLHDSILHALLYFFSFFSYIHWNADWLVVIASSAGHCPLLYFAWHNKKIQKFRKGIGQWCHRHQIRHTHIHKYKCFFVCNISSSWLWFQQILDCHFHVYDVQHQLLLDTANPTAQHLLNFYTKFIQFPSSTDVVVSTKWVKIISFQMVRAVWNRWLSNSNGAVSFLEVDISFDG